MLRPPVVVEPVPPLVSLWTDGWGIITEGVAANAPASGVWESAGRGIWYPLYVPTVCVVKRMWWTNGSTASGSYVVEAGIYADAGGKPGHKIATTGAVPQGTASEVQFAGFGTSSGVLASGQAQTGTDGTIDSSSVTFRAVANTLYAVTVVVKTISGADVGTMASVATIGGGITFTERVAYEWQMSATPQNAKTFLYTASAPASDVTDAVRITFTTARDYSIDYAVVEVLNVDTTTNHGIVQTATAAGNSPTSLATLSAFASASNGTLGIAGAGLSTPSVGTGFGLVAQKAFQNTGMLVEHKAVADTGVDASNGAGDYWGMVAAEIARKGSGVVLTPGLYWLYHSASTTSATFLRTLASHAALDELVRFQQASVGPGASPSPAIPVEGANTDITLFGIEPRAELSPTASSTVVNSATDSFSPSGSWADGDLMVAIATSADAGGGATAPTLPSGWTEVQSGSDFWDDGEITGTDYYLVAYKVKSGTGSVTFTNASQVSVVALSGVHPTNPVASSAESAGGFNVTLPNARLDSTLVYLSMGVGDSITPPSGMTELVDYQDARRVGIAWETTITGGSFTKTATYVGEPALVDNTRAAVLMSVRGV